MPTQNIVRKENIDVTAREVDFVTRFSNNWEHLAEILGIMRKVKKANGTQLKVKKATGSLNNTQAAEGEVIPYSLYGVVEEPYESIAIEKYRKGTSIEAIAEYGYDVAVQMTDDEFLFDLQTKVTDKFYTFLKTGTLIGKRNTWQKTMAMAMGHVVNRFKAMHKTTTGVVGFVNTLDVYEYLGNAPITIQSEFGFTYIKNFLGYNTVFLLGETEIPKGTVIATPIENLILYYVDPSDSEFARAGLPFTTAGETNLIGVHAEGNYATAVSDIFALMGITLMAEYIDAVAVFSVNATESDPSIPLPVKPDVPTGDSAGE